MILRFIYLVFRESLWTPELFNSSPPPALQTWKGSSSDIHTCTFACIGTHMHTHILRRTHTHNTNARSIERLAQRSCQCGFIFLLIDTSCETLRHAHMCTCIQSDCTCHLSWIVLPLPHFVLPVHHLYSSSAVSSMGSCETLLSVCVWKVFRPAAWRRSAHPPLSCLAVGQLRWYTVFASGCVCLSVCVGKCIHCR